MKKILLGLLFINSFLFQSKAQVTFSVSPLTPLEYMAFELTTPAIKAGYSKRTNYFGETTFIPTEVISLLKYSDLPLYSLYKEEVDLFITLEVRAIPTRTSEYVSYLVEAREEPTDTYVPYAKDTFFLSGTTITSIKETIYDTESESNAVLTNAEYTVSYHSNGKIKSIDLKDYSGYDLSFAGISIVYNENNTISSDTTYRFGYNFNGERKALVSFYHENYYNINNAQKPDSSYYFNINRIPQQSERLYYVTDANNRIVEIRYNTYDSQTKTYDFTYRHFFEQDITLPISKSNQISNVAVFPNPAQDVISISEGINFTIWSIADLTGKVIQQGENKTNNRIDVVNLKQGLYMLNITVGKSQELGNLSAPGSSLWKLNAFRNFLTDVSALIHKTRIFRISPFDNLLINGKMIKVKDLLFTRTEANDNYLFKYIERGVKS